MSRPGSMPRRLAALAVGVAALAGPTALVATADAGGSTAATPACTATALQAGLSRGAAPVAHGHVVKPFGCSGRWAYAAVDTTHVTRSALFHVREGRWVTVTRTRPCADGAVPKAIRKPACQSN
jgi:hypothetical protein